MISSIRLQERHSFLQSSRSNFFSIKVKIDKQNRLSNIQTFCQSSLNFSQLTILKKSSLLTYTNSHMILLHLIALLQLFLYIFFEAIIYFRKLLENQEYLKQQKKEFLFPGGTPDVWKEIICPFGNSFIQNLKVLRYNIQNRQNSHRKKASMSMYKNYAVQKAFTIIRQLQQNRQNFKPLESLILFMDYAILISLTFWSSLQTTSDESPLPAIPQNSTTFNQIFHLVTNLHLSIILIFLFSIALHFIITTSLISNKFHRHIVDLTIGKVILISSWMYQSTLVPFFALVAQTQSADKIFSFSQAPVLLSMLTACFYLILLNHRKFYGESLPIIFLVRLFLGAQMSAIVTIILSLLRWRATVSRMESIVYIQMFLLEVSQYIRKVNQIPLTKCIIMNSAFILLVVTAVQSMRGSILDFEEDFKEKFEESIYETIKKIKQKEYDSLSLKQKLMVQAFQASQVDSLVKISTSDKESIQDRLCNSLQLKLNQQIQKDPKFVSKLILKIRLNCLRNASLMSIFKMLEQLNLAVSSQSYKDRYIVFCFIDQALSKLNIKYQLNLSQIRENDKIQQSNEREIQQFVKSLIDFWEYLLHDTLSEEVIMQKLANLYKYEKILMMHLEHFKKYPNLKSCLIVLQFAIKCLNPHFEVNLLQEETPSLLNQKHLQGASYFLSIEANHIKYMSSSLCKKLGFDKLLIEDEDKSLLFPRYVSNFQHLVTLQEQKRQLMLFPLISSQGYMQPFLGRMFIKPNFQSSFSYFFQLEQLREKYPFMIINTTKEHIDLASKSFLSFFRDIDEGPVSDINLEQLFCYKYHDLIKSSLTEVCVEMRTAKDERSLVKITKICTYKQKENNYLLVKMEFSKGMSSNTMLQIFIQQSTEETGENKYEKYRNETFFCKITHPLENKYNQEVQRINDPNRWTLSQKHKRIFILIFIILLFNVTFNKVAVHLNYRSSVQSMIELDKVNTARNKLLMLFERCYELFQLRNSNPSFIFASITDQITKYEQQINRLIHDISVSRYHNQNYISPFALHLTFPSFTIKTSTINTNIIDITQNAKLFLANNDPSFLVHNFHFLSTYNNAYDILSLLQHQNNSENNPIIYTMIASCSLMGLILVVIFWDIKESIEGGRQVMKIIMNSKEKIVEGKLELLRHFQHFLSQNEEHYFFKQDTNSNIKRQSQITSLIKHQKKFQAKSEIDMRFINEREDNIMHKEDNYENEQERQAKKLLFTLHSKQVFFSNRAVVYFKESYFLGIFGLMLLLFFRTFTLSTHFTLEKNTLLDYYDDFYSAQRKIVGLSLSVRQRILQNKFNITGKQKPISSVIMNTHFLHPLPQWFNGYIYKKQQIINSNLCEQQNSIQSFTPEQCDSLLGGIFTKGLGVVFQIYVNLIGDIQSEISNATAHSQPSIMSQLQLIQMLMVSKIDIVKTQFFKTAQVFLLSRANTLIYHSLYQETLIFVGVLIVYFLGMQHYKRRSALILKGFLILPKEYILNNRLLKYFTKHRVFEGLASI